MKLKRDYKSAILLAFVAALIITLPVVSLPVSAGFGAAAPVTVAVQTRNIQQPLTSSARTSSANTSFIDVPPGHDRIVACLSVTASSGSSPTLDVKIQDSFDGGTTPFDIAGMTFTQVTGSTATQCVQNTRPFGGKVRVSYTIGGSSPSFTFSLTYYTYQGTPLIVSSADANAANLTSGTLPNARLVDVAASNLAEDVIRTASVTVPTASVLALNTTPYTLIAAPGAGKIILIEEITCKLVFNSVAYTGSNALEFRYTNGSGAKVTADMPSSFLNSASGTNYQTVKSVVTTLTPVANAAVVAFVPTANPGAGNSDLVFKIKYRVVMP